MNSPFLNFSSYILITWKMSSSGQESPESLSDLVINSLIKTKFQHYFIFCFIFIDLHSTT